MKDYLKRLAELAGAGFVAGASAHVVQNGFELSEAGVKGLLVAGLLAAYGLVVRKAGEANRPTVG
jgi:hypothetical protein